VERRHRNGRSEDAFTLLELLIALTLVGIAVGIGATGFRHFSRSVALDHAADVVQGELARAKMLAVSRREAVGVRLSSSGRMSLEAADGTVLSRRDLSRGALRVDRAEIRPRWFRFNSRGMASPGSVYLYRGDRGIRLVSNFLGRVRRERIRAP
jgi:prepilin-type N-terminal cleavage/methylation domain-containing protein